MEKAADACRQGDLDTIKALQDTELRRLISKRDEDGRYGVPGYVQTFLHVLTMTSAIAEPCCTQLLLVVTLTCLSSLSQRGHQQASTSEMKRCYWLKP